MKELLELLKEFLQLKKCSIKYEDHSYVKLRLIKEKIKTGNVAREDMTTQLFQREYFRFIADTHPGLKYHDICLDLIDK